MPRAIVRHPAFSGMKKRALRPFFHALFAGWSAADLECFFTDFGGETRGMAGIEKHLTETRKLWTKFISVWSA